MTRTDELVVLSGVSRSTVFRFLRGESVRPHARSAILSAMQQLNIPHDEHRDHTGKMLQISIRPDFKMFKGYGLAIAGFMSRAEAAGYQVNLRAGNLSTLEAGESGLRKSLQHPAGVLILGMTAEEEEKDARILSGEGIPHVFVNRVFDDPSKSWVSCNLRQAAREAVEHLIDLGYTEIGTWGVPDSYRIDRDKLAGYADAFGRRGMPVPDCRFDFHRDGDLEAVVQRLIDGKKLPPAWFAASDEHAMRFIKAARTNGIRIPEDVAIVGMDDVESSEYFSPSLTTIHIPFHAAGAAAFDVLAHLLENPDEVSVRVLLKHRLIVRESCGAKCRTPGSV